MKSRLKPFVSIMLAVMIALSMLSVSAFTSLAAETISYSFSNNDAGYADGTISLTATSGTYQLYWADNEKAIDGYDAIATLSFSSNTTKTVKMPANTAIPAGATKVIAVKVGEKSNTVYFINNVGWTNVYCHAYNSSNTSIRNASWPGVKMTYVEKNSDGYGVYSIELSSEYNEMQFDNGSSGNKNQTVDLTIGSKNAYIISDPTSSSKYNANNIPYGSEGETTVSYLVKDAAAVYSVPQSKLLTSNMIYSFANYSDIQLDSVPDTYTYSYQNFKNALELAASKNVDFIVTAGDNVNSQYLNIQKTEWNDFLNILANSSYSNPMYECIGNHELWPFKDSGFNNTNSITMFQKNSGLDNNLDTINSGKSYFEITENGDHFIFLALEGSFHVNDDTSVCSIEEFSDEQLAWFKGLLDKYSGDGHNIFVIEHALFYKYGAGDRIDGTPYYSGYLNESRPSTQKLKALFEEYKDIIYISGHTHIELAEQYNYSTNGGTSCQMIHDSSVGGSRNIVNSALNFSYSTSETEGYIVEVYPDRIIFRGTNITSGLALPTCTYLVKTSSQMIGKESVVLPKNICGDTDGNGIVNVIDATNVQKYVSALLTDKDIISANADTNADGKVDIKDATLIQKYIAGMYEELPLLSDYDMQIVDFTELLTNCRNMLSRAVSYASYNQYMSLKKEYRAVVDGSKAKTIAEYNKLSAYLDEMVKIADINPDKSTVDIYFENTKSWSSVYAYAWGGGNNNASWPGEKLTQIGTSKSGKQVFKLTVNMDDYTSIIFNSGSNAAQTVDIPLSGNDVAYTVSGSDNGKFTVSEIAISNLI